MFETKFGGDPLLQSLRTEKWDHSCGPFFLTQSITIFFLLVLTLKEIFLFCPRSFHMFQVNNKNTKKSVKYVES